jgi:peptidoglycan/xylan/chitin deacetylase (PgdA/CDA1 family)
MSTLKETLLRVVTHPAATAPLAPLLRNQAAVFMLHRFAHAGRGVTGHDPAELHRTLGALRRERRTIISLETLFARLESAEPLRGAVVFTIDDGYAEQVEIGAPVFAEFDCPVTTFVTTGFLDEVLWFWWDRIEYVFRTTRRSDLEVVLAGEAVGYHWSSVAERDRAQADFTARCKEVPDSEKHTSIERLAERAEVSLPSVAPVQYAPMSWEQLRASEGKGMTFGPHTVTHPILSRTGDTQARHEVVESWRRLSEQAAHPVPIFCYPNGRPADFGPREYAVMRHAGMRGAVVGSPGYAALSAFRAGADAPFNVRRFAYPDSLPYMRQFVSGLEYVKTRLRGGRWD